MAKLTIWLKRNYSNLLIRYHFWRLKAALSRIEKLLLSLQSDICRPSTTTRMRVQIMRFLERNDCGPNYSVSYGDPSVAPETRARLYEPELIEPEDTAQCFEYMGRLH